MKILYFSDMHVEFWGRHDVVLPNLPDPNEYDVVVAAGDIGYDIQGLIWLDRLFPQDKPILFVPGNHEYYTKPFDETKALFDSYQGRVQILNPGFVEIEGVSFVGGTIWSDLVLKGYMPLRDEAVERSIADFRWGWTAADMRKLNQQEIEYVQRTLNTCENVDFVTTGIKRKTVVITHFVPTQLCIDERWVGSFLNPYFTNDLDWLMKDYKPDVWIFGHTHDRYDIIHPSGTRVVGNPHGYPGENKQPFEWKIIEV